uniref:Uncharacterized protein n=1 Tax=Setaria viridis TaxID=4556 RepID=A0A4U6V1Q3_SETVI|nr:hypothetical protein SEVIR_4G263301v2 [Setaria viridis]
MEGLNFSSHNPLAPQGVVKWTRGAKSDPLVHFSTRYLSHPFSLLPLPHARRHLLLPLPFLIHSRLDLAPPPLPSLTAPPPLTRLCRSLPSPRPLRRRASAVLSLPLTVALLFFPTPPPSLRRHPASVHPSPPRAAAASPPHAAPDLETPLARGHGRPQRRPLLAAGSALPLRRLRPFLAGGFVPRATIRDADLGSELAGRRVPRLHLVRRHPPG